MPIKYELSNFDYVFGGNRTHDPYANSLEHYLLDYQGILKEYISGFCWISAFSKLIRLSVIPCRYLMDFKEFTSQLHICTFATKDTMEIVSEIIAQLLKQN